MDETMLDLETMSTEPNAAIIAIGAVKFTQQGGISDTFYRNVYLESCTDVGLHVSKSTTDWWKAQDDLAKHKLKGGRVNIHKALSDFAEWYTPKSLLWGNGAAFDNIILSLAYKACGIEAPWKFWDDRCYRTMRDVKPNVHFIKPLIPHYALDDAKAQAKHLILVRSKL